MEPTLLGGAWRLRAVEAFAEAYPDDDAWHEQVLPGHWQDLPALETHTGKVVYRKRFAFTPDGDGRGHRHWLRLRGVFYRYRVKLNGAVVGSAEGYFFPHEFEVTDLLRPENDLEIEVDSPVERNSLDKQTITGVFAHWDALSSYKYNAGGLWLPVELVRHADVHIERALVHLERFDDQAAHVALRLDLKVASPGPARWHVTFTPRNFAGEPVTFEGEVELAAGRYGWQQQLSLSPYKLWWSHDLGHPHLYDVAVRLDGPHPATWTGTTGLRTWEMRDWIGHLNGQRLYAKGSNYPPSDARMATMTPARAAEDMALAKGAHMNMIRIHAHVDHPAVYAAADEAGILLWQDFPMQWMYARSVLPEAMRQSQEMVKLLYNHPSIVIWCLHNEPLHVDDTSVEPLLRQLKTYWSMIYSWNRDHMDAQMARAAQHLDPNRFVIRSSGEMWIPGWHAGTDGHYYFGWYMSYGPKRWFDLWRRVFTRNLRFVTEFGAQSFPDLESSRKFLPDDLAGSDKRFLTEHYLLQWDLMGLWIDTSSQRLEDLVPRSQAYHAEINRYYVDRLRFYKYRPNGGFLNFMFTDAQPGVTWSIVDYWRRPKAIVYAAYKQALAPLYAFCLTPRDRYRPNRAYKLPLYAVNDAHRPAPMAIAVALLAPDGTEAAARQHGLTLTPDCEAQSLGALPFAPDRPGTWKLVLSWRDLDGAPQENTYDLDVR